MSSRFYPSLLSQLWTSLPLPEWLPAADQTNWQQALNALTQLWREAGRSGLVISGPLPWLPLEDWQWQAEWSSSLGPDLPSDPTTARYLQELADLAPLLHLADTVHPIPSVDPVNSSDFPGFDPTHHLASPTLPSGLFHFRDHRWLFTPELTPALEFDLNQRVIPLLHPDPLRQERFLILLSPIFSAILAHGSHPSTGQVGMMVSFEPDVIERAWKTLTDRVRHIRPDLMPIWDAIAYHVPPQPPHYRVMARFSSLLLMTAIPIGDPSRLAQLPPPTTESPSPEDPTSAPMFQAQEFLPDPETSASLASPNPHRPAHTPPAEVVAKDRSHHTHHTYTHTQSTDRSHSNPVASLPGSSDSTASSHSEADSQEPISEVELLRALIHEVKTPLTTIRTWVALAKRQKNLPPKVRDYLDRIDRECEEQIARFSLFFQATEINPKLLHLEPTALVDLVRQNLPKWQDQVERRESTLEMEIPNDLPDVVSDPKTLDAVLSGIIERIARWSPPGSVIKAQLVNAGEHVKLQFQVNTDHCPVTQPLAGMMPAQSIGQLLVLQPDTGAISLSIPVTQHLIRALGGYLTVRQRAQQGETITFYLPRQA